jgi:dihydrofolate synthase/folylpolyglutamate synthase
MERNVTEYLHSLRGRGAKLGLGRVEALVKALGNPQEGYKSILVGGTSGKGSTTVMLSSILMSSGFRVGTFTSPHLSGLTERIMVDGERIPEKEFVRIVNIIKDTIEGLEEHPTFFEVITAAALLYFKERQVDYAVLEVGLGGRLDATRLASPVLSVITNVSLEHTKILGSTVKEIAGEKAGIIQEKGTLVTAAEGEALEAFGRICREKGSGILVVGIDIIYSREDAGLEGQRFSITVPDSKHEGFEIPLLGKHQLENAACAVAAAHALIDDISADAIRKGLRQVRWPGRMEVMQERPLVLLDCAKDPEAMRCLRETVEEDIPHDRIILVLGISSDKDIGRMVDIIAPIADETIITAHKVMERAAEPERIVEEVKRNSRRYTVIDDVKEAVKRAISMAGEGDLVLVTGSLFTVAEARELWDSEQNAWGRELNEIPEG